MKISILYILKVRYIRYPYFFNKIVLSSINMFKFKLIINLGNKKHLILIKIMNSHNYLIRTSCFQKCSTIYTTQNSSYDTLEYILPLTKRP
jgi:hypothetical protein